jgi:hypothetical protein
VRSPGRREGINAPQKKIQKYSLLKAVVAARRVAATKDAKRFAPERLQGLIQAALPPSLTDVTAVGTDIATK